jgi:hypothetical protein
MTIERNKDRKKSKKEAVYRSVAQFEKQFFPVAHYLETTDESPADRAMGAGDAGANEAKESLNRLRSQSSNAR